MTGRIRKILTKMNDGRTHLAHKAEHAVDMETERLSQSAARRGPRPPRADGK